MNIEIQASNRKVLAQAIAEEIHEPVRYLGTPSYAYQIGRYTIDRDAVIHGDDFEPLRDFLVRNGYIAADAQLTDAPVEPATEAQSEQPDEEPAEDEQTERTDDEHPDDDFKAEDDEKDDPSDHTIPQAYNLTIRAPLGADMTPQKLTNFLRMLYARQDLIAAMTGSTLLHLDEEVITLLNETKPDTIEAIAELLKRETAIGMVSGIEITFSRQWLLATVYRSDLADTVPWSIWQDLMNRILAAAKTAKHVSTKRISPEDTEMKYFCNTWLMQLHMSGVDFKAHRKALLGHLHGYAAFRTSDKMQAHREKYKTQAQVSETTTDETEEQHNA